MPPPTPSPAQLRDCLSVVEQLVSQVVADQWTAPTPCTEWDVRALVAHVVGGNLMFAGIVGGRTTLEELRAQGAPGDLLGDDAAQAFRDAAAAVVAAFERPRALDGVVTIPFGTVPAVVALHLRITDVLAHGWDLGRALGVDVVFDEDVVEQELAFSAGAVQQVPAERKVFAASTSAPDDAPVLDRLAALLGRTV